VIRPFANLNAGVANLLPNKALHPAGAGGMVGVGG